MLRRDPGRPRAQVEARSNRLAHHLVSLGVALGSAVGLLLEPSADAIIAALAVLKAGACYLPLDVASNELLKLMLEVRHGFLVQQPLCRRIILGLLPVASRCALSELHSTCVQACMHHVSDKKHLPHAAYPRCASQHSGK